MKLNPSKIIVDQNRVRILGGGNDLTEAIKRMSSGTEYTRIATAAYREASGDQN